MRRRLPLRAGGKRLGTVAIAVAAIALLAAASRSDRGSAAAAGVAHTLRDPALRTGTLANGLRYYVRANAMPAGRAELRLVVNAGSVLEDDDQQGMAHFLEHMAFNGTRHFPHQSLVDFVESSGMRFGADLNAYTNFDETVYMLTVPTDEPRFLEQGMTVLQDWASGGVTLDSAEIVAERGVVMGEWRSRLPDTTSQKLQAHQREVLFGAGSRYLERLPIGDTSQVEHAHREPVERFYRDWYRPDLMAVVVVGDVGQRRARDRARVRHRRYPQSVAASRRRLPAADHRRCSGSRRGPQLGASRQHHRGARRQTSHAARAAARHDRAVARCRRGIAGG